MSKHVSIAVTGLVSARRHRFVCAPTPTGAALAESLVEALSGAGIAPDGMGAPAGCRLPALVPAAMAAPAGGYGKVLCELPGLLWAMEEAAAALPEVLFVVCYEAPWLAVQTLLEQAPERFLSDPGAALEVWRNYYREALRLRTVLGPRMVLLNAQLTGAWDAQLLAYLGERDLVLERSAGPAGGARQQGWDEASARLLDIAAPHYWDLYEALEGCALLLGRAPQFRQALAAPSAACADAVLRQWSAAHGERSARAGLDAAARRVRELEAELAKERGHIVSLRENLLAQAHDFAARCDALDASAQAAAAVAACAIDALRAELAAVRAASLDQQQQFATRWRDLEHSAAAANLAATDELHAAQAERADMLALLHATQEMLEQSYAESDALSATATRANALLRQAWLLVAAQPQRAGTDLPL